MATIYVLSKDGKPLDPTTRCRHVRVLLKQKKARVIQTKPFTIQLNYEAQNPDITQQYTLGIDPGRTNIGLNVVNQDTDCVFDAEVVTRNKDIPQLMNKRKAHRSAHRHYGRRQRRQRRAFKCGSTTQRPCEENYKVNQKKSVGIIERMLPGCEEPIHCIGIKNKEARFNNRTRKLGWLTSTANHLLQTHLALVREVQAILPVSQVVLELNQFAFMQLENPAVAPWEYRNGPLKGFKDVEDAVNHIQDGHCLFCGKPIAHHHHIVPRSKGGSDGLLNRAGLCEEHHDLVHKFKEWEDKMKALKEGLHKKYGALSVLNQIIPQLIDELEKMLPTYVTTGQSTKAFREKFGIEKQHSNDAYAIACSALNPTTIHVPEGEPYLIRQFRRQDRQICHQQMIDRKYYLDGKVVATNRHKRTEQKADSLEEFRNTHAQAEISRLQVKKHKAQNKNPMRQMPGSVFLVENEKRRHVLVKSTGFHNKKPDYYIDTQGNKYKSSKCKFVENNKGLVFV